MKVISPPFFRLSLLWFFATYLLPISVFCQGYERVMHLSGTVQIGCTDVTVTSTGGVFTNNPNICDADPYRVGYLNNPGSYTFTFSNPIAGARINAAAIDNVPPNAMDELAIDVNGSFYPITIPGAPSCTPNWVVIWPPGTLRAVPGVIGASTEGIMINETMTSLTVANNFTNGLIFSLYILACPPCMTDAGEIVSSPILLCPNDLATAPPATQTFLESGDILQYILFSDLADTLGSVIATNSTPEFAFDPGTMQTGIIYYLAAMAGNDLGGNVDPDDPCLDISNAIPVIWNAYPTVEFSVANPEICADNCIDVTVNFTGSPPFTLVYFDQNLNYTTANFSGNSGTVEVCIPPNTPPGDWQVHAEIVEDAFCSCN